MALNCFLSFGEELQTDIVKQRSDLDVEKQELKQQAAEKGGGLEASSAEVEGYVFSWLCVLLYFGVERAYKDFAGGKCSGSGL